MSLEAVFVRAGERYRATELGRGPWDPTALHGGAPAALLVHAFDDATADSGLRLARITYEFVRPVPLGELEVEVAVVRPGRRVMLLEGTIRDAQGTEVTRARALKLQPSQISDPEAGSEPRPPFPGPEAGAPNDFGQGPRMFATHAMEIRFVQGGFHREPGPATAWFRLQCPLIAGQPLQPLERAAAAGDFGNGISSVLSWDDYIFINPDLTLYLDREPRGEWVAVQAQTLIRSGSTAVAEAVLWDHAGRIGRATQSLLVAARDPGAT
jgi:hypothetical protein